MSANELDMNKINKLRKMLEESSSVVFFGGAGVSTESQIPDFRSQNGIYQQKQFKYPPEIMLSHDFFENHTYDFFDFYGTMLFPDAKPNAAHIKLAQWEREGKLKAVITQNIDGLHQAAGSKTVHELHGSVLRNYCTNHECHKFFDIDYILKYKGEIPYCDECGSVIKPDVVLYGEGLDNSVINGAVQAIKDADMLIVGGTSLVVYPAAGLINYYHGNKLVLVNRDATSFDSGADLIIHDSIGKVFSSL